MLKDSFLLLIFLFLLGCNSSPDRKAITTENIKKGETLFRNVGCTTCHSVSGEVRYGPPLNTIYNTEIVVLHNGIKHTVKVDREYIQRSIQDPDFDKVDGFQTKKMTKPTLSEEEIDYIIDYLISMNVK